MASLKSFKYCEDVCLTQKAGCGNVKSSDCIFVEKFKDWFPVCLTKISLFLLTVENKNYYNSNVTYAAASAPETPGNC